MKRIITIVLGVAALAGASYLGSRLWAQPPGPAAAPPAAPALPAPTMKLAVFNLGQVINSYKKWDTYKDELKRARDQADVELKSVKTNLDAQKAKLAALPPGSPEAEAAGRTYKDMERKAQDRAEEWNVTLGKQELARLAQVFDEIQDMVGRYARMRGIELVVHYNDAPPPLKDDLQATQGLLRRHLTTAALMPMYHHPGLDITRDIIENLNRQYQPPVTPVGH